LSVEKIYKGKGSSLTQAVGSSRRFSFGFFIIIAHHQHHPSLSTTYIFSYILTMAHVEEVPQDTPVDPEVEKQRIAAERAEQGTSLSLYILAISSGV